MKIMCHEACGGWKVTFTRGIITILAAGALTLAGAAHVHATETPQAKLDVANLCELASAKPIAYKLAAGPWLGKQPGTVMAALPLEIRAGEAPCQIKLEKQAVLQAQAGSELELRRDGKGLLLTIRKGGIYYGLASGVTMKVAVSSGSVIAQAGGSSAVKNSSNFASMGVIRVLPGKTPSLDLANIQGQASVVQSGASAKEIAVGQKLRYDNGATLIVAQNAEPATRPVPVGESAAAPAMVAPPSAPATPSAATAAPMSAAGLDKVLRSSNLPGAINDNLSTIATPIHVGASPYIPPPRNRGPLPSFLVP